MTHEPYLSPRNQQTPYFQNRLLSLNVKINNQEEIYKDSKEITGVILLTPKLKMQNLPIQINIIGESQCIIFDQNQQNNLKFQQKSANPFSANQTEQDIIDKRNQVQKCLQSTEYLSQNFLQNPIIDQKAHIQIFLQGKQTLYQTFGQQKKEKLQFLQPQKQYCYEFTFFLPSNLPSSVNQKMFDGVHLIVNYRIQGFIDLNKDYFVFQNQKIKKEFSNEGQHNVQIKKSFQIRRTTQVSNCENLSNKMVFKYFHQDGKQVDNEFIQNCSCLKYFYQKITKRPMKYDIYHCQILTTIDSFKILHLTARIFIQPNKNHLDKRKVKKGKFYSSSKSSQSNTKKQKQQKDIKKDEQLTISKVMDTGRQKQLNVKVRHILVTMYGEIIGVKKVKLFEKMIEISRQMYDISEGQMITQVPFQYFSEKNQLFQIRFWFEITPLSQFQAQMKKQQQKDKSRERQNNKQNKQNANEFELTMSQLNEGKQIEEQEQDKEENQRFDILQKNRSRYLEQKVIQKISQEVNDIKL